MILYRLSGQLSRYVTRDAAYRLEAKTRTTLKTNSQELLFLAGLI